MTIPLGFFLMRQGLRLPTHPAITYRGVDRLPLTPNPLDIPSTGPNGKSGWDLLWQDYWSVQDTGALHRDLSISKDFARRFRSFDLNCDVVYASVAALPADCWLKGNPVWRSSLEQILHQTQATASSNEPPAHFAALGFDVAWPVPSFHSAIFQPGLDAVAPDFHKDLNASGLFSDESTGFNRFEQALSLRYGVVPFCLLQVFADSTTK